MIQDFYDKVMAVNFFSISKTKYIQPHKPGSFRVHMR